MNWGKEEDRLHPIDLYGVAEDAGASRPLSNDKHIRNRAQRKSGAPNNLPSTG